MDTQQPSALSATAFGLTDPGKVRQSNEDQFLIAELSKRMQVWQTSLPEPQLQVGEDRAHLFLVADGMGGHSAGERASTIAVAAIEQFTLNTFRWFFAADSPARRKCSRSSRSALSQADAKIVEEAAENPELHGMGTTLTMAFQLGSQLCIVHVGDSRAYMYRAGQLHQLTQDHTLVAEMVQSGAIQQEQVASHHLRHVITNVVGGPNPGVTVEARAFEVQVGDRLLLCSDGLTEMVTNEVIIAALDQHTGPEDAARALLTQANENGRPGQHHDCHRTVRSGSRARAGECGDAVRPVRRRHRYGIVATRPNRIRSVRRAAGGSSWSFRRRQRWRHQSIRRARRSAVERWPGRGPTRASRRLSRNDRKSAGTVGGNARARVLHLDRHHQPRLIPTMRHQPAHAGAPGRRWRPGSQGLLVRAAD